MSRCSFARVPVSSHHQSPGTWRSYGPGRTCVFWPPWIIIQQQGVLPRQTSQHILAVTSFLFHMEGDTHGRRARRKKRRCKWGFGNWTLSGGVGMRNICPGNQIHRNYCSGVNDGTMPVTVSSTCQLVTHGELPRKRVPQLKNCPQVGLWWWCLWGIS